MNVENRKLFANRDARKRLAEMGGILASSPELMGEAMKFANGGGGELSYIVSNIPGLVAQYEYVRVDVPTMQMLNDRFPQLMQQATVEEESMAPSAVRTRARPQTILGTRIGRMMETQQAAPEEVVLESAPITSGRERAISGEGALDQFAAPRSSASTPSDMSLMDRIRSTVQSAETVPLFELPEVDFQKLDRDIGSSIQAADRAVQGKMVEVLGDVYQIIADDIRGDIDRIKIIRASTGTEVTDPAIKQAVLSNQRIAGEDMAMAQDVPQGQPRVFAQPEVMSPESEPEVMFPGELLNAMNPAFDSFGGDLLANDVRGVKDVRGAKDLMAGPIYPAEERSSTSKLSSMDFSTDPTKGYPFPTDVPKDDPKYEAQSVVEAMTKSSNPAELEAQLEAIQDRKAEARRPQEMADAEREQMTGMPDLAAPEKVDVDVLLDAVEKNDPKAASAALMKSITGVDVHGGTTPPPSGDTPDAPKPDAPKTRKQRMLESVEMISELFGIREKDKAEDMYDLMATIGFAMASGESPNAMKNIADAFLVGAQMKRADKKEDKKLDQAIKTLAVKDVLEQESDERALNRLLAKEERAKTQALEIYVQKLEAAEEFEDPKSIFANEPYKSMAIIARQDPPNTDPDQTVIERLTAGGFNPAAINTFIKAMQLSTEAGAGAGVTPGQVQNLDQIPDGT